MTDQRCSSLCRLQHIHTLPVSQPPSLASLAITPPVSSSPLISATYRQFILKTVPPTPFIMGPFSSQSLFHKIHRVSATPTIKSLIHRLQGTQSITFQKKRKNGMEFGTESSSLGTRIYSEYGGKYQNQSHKMETLVCFFGVS